MAVTQQIARLTLDELERCRASVAEVDRLCSFALRPRSDYLDLNWWPTALKRAAAASAARSALSDAIDRACHGGIEVNPAYRDAPVTIWEHPVTALEPSAVCEVAADLGRVDPADLLDGLPRDPEEAQRALGLEARDVHAGLVEQYAFLQRFYVEACEHGLATAMWWD